ncbi:uncharacterized protein MONBRDRAFT_10984 [Monosiga brevicollis MX1]|uniref:Uncharacterized protein n=1 Tax=Monosiga brevicollis TaxID=81824 RepID=A9V7V0_MONBE|nr:uncharacterized protein MONBRDRAFT_10984 [Monosiga brevicollis MX1]EDQ86368.1 predicted protein [Monosiga brevicollis MX1]|eukprot:XP_001748758.1 hypothetical protein [Monosiga brevicollis MX1]
MDGAQTTKMLWLDFIEEFHRLKALLGGTMRIDSGNDLEPIWNVFKIDTCGTEVQELLRLCKAENTIMTNKFLLINVAFHTAIPDHLLVQFVKDLASLNICCYPDATKPEDGDFKKFRFQLLDTAMQSELFLGPHSKWCSLPSPSMAVSHYVGVYLMRRSANGQSHEVLTCLLNGQATPKMAFLGGSINFAKDKSIAAGAKREVYEETYGQVNLDLVSLEAAHAALQSGRPKEVLQVAQDTGMQAWRARAARSVQVTIFFIAQQFTDQVVATINSHAQNAIKDWERYGEKTAHQRGYSYPETKEFEFVKITDNSWPRRLRSAEKCTFEASKSDRETFLHNALPIPPQAGRGTARTQSRKHGGRADRQQGGYFEGYGQPYHDDRSDRRQGGQRQGSGQPRYGGRGGHGGHGGRGGRGGHGGRGGRGGPRNGSGRGRFNGSQHDRQGRQGR